MSAFNLTEVKDYTRMDHEVVFFYHMSMVMLSLTLTTKLRYYDRRIPSEKVSVFTILKQFVIENINYGLMHDMLPYMFKQLICPVHPYIGIFFIHAIVFHTIVATHTVIAIYVVKQVLVRSPGYLETFNQAKLAKGTKMAVVIIDAAQLVASYISYLTFYRNPFEPVAYWGNVAWDSGEVFDIPLTLMAGNLGLCVLLVGIDGWVNRHVPHLQLKKLRPWLTVLGTCIVAIIVGQNFVVPDSFPLIGIAHPICAVYALISFAEDSYLKDLEYEEERREREELQKACSSELKDASDDGQDSGRLDRSGNNCRVERF